MFHVKASGGDQADEEVLSQIHPYVDSPRGIVDSRGCTKAWLWDEIEGSDVEEEQKIGDDYSDGKAREAIAHKWESSC